MKAATKAALLVGASIYTACVLPAAAKGSTFDGLTDQQHGWSWCCYEVSFHKMGGKVG